MLGYDGMNNFYLYRVGEQAQLIPWDRDQAFRAVDYPLLAGADENVLMRRLLEDPAAARGLRRRRHRGRWPWHRRTTGSKAS